MARNDSVAATVDQARAALRAGNALLCFEIVERGFARGLHDPELEYLAILALANCGSTRQALERYHRSKDAVARTDQDWLALEGRLFKDLAMQGGDGTHFLFTRAAEAYWQAFQKTGGYFSAINAATMFLLAGDEDRARALAHDVLALTGDAAGDDELERYNLLASHAEAALLLGEPASARNALRSADLLARDHRSARARTARQLQLICHHKRIDKTIPALLSVPPQVFVHRADEIDVGTSTSELNAAVERMQALPFELRGALVHLCLEAPVDLCVAELFIARGAHVKAVMPGIQDVLVLQWQQRYGAAWAMRLGHVSSRVGDIVPAHGFLDGEPLWLRRHLAGTALGLSRHAPDPLSSEWIGLSVQKQTAAPGFALTMLNTAGMRVLSRALADAQCPLSEEPRTSGVRERRLCGLLVARFADDTAADDAALLQLRSAVLTPLARHAAASAPRLIQRASRNGVVEFVSSDCATAVELALACSEFAAAAHEPGEATTALPRVLVHCGPVFVGEDVLTGAPACFGSELAFAGSQSAVVPGGVFITEAGVARMGIEGQDDYRFEYVGTLPEAGTRGSGRLFSVRRRQ